MALSGILKLSNALAFFPAVRALAYGFTKHEHYKHLSLCEHGLSSDRHFLSAITRNLHFQPFYCTLFLVDWLVFLSRKVSIVFLFIRGKVGVQNKNRLMNEPAFIGIIRLDKYGYLGPVAYNSLPNLEDGSIDHKQLFLT